MDYALNHPRALPPKQPDQTKAKGREATFEKYQQRNYAAQPTSAQ